MNDRTMTVKGVGKVIARPDIILFDFDIVSKDMEYDAVMEQAAIRHEQLRNALERIGIDRNELKTSDFQIQTNYIDEVDRTGRAQRIFDGYTSHHRLQLETYFDMALLSRIIDAIAVSQSMPEFNIRFSIRDKHRLTQELLTDAVNNAIMNANILARAASVLLRDIVSITYDWSDLEPFSPTRFSTYSNPLMRSEVRSLDFAPDDIEVTDSVTVIWEIIS